MTTGAELEALDAAAHDGLRVADDLARQRAGLRAALAELAAASGLRVARLACEESGQVLDRAWRGLHDGVLLLGDDAAVQHDRFARADRR